MMTPFQIVCAIGLLAWYENPIPLFVFIVLVSCLNMYEADKEKPCPVIRE